MKRTQIYIEENLHKQVTQLAERRGFSMAEIIRDFIRTGLNKQKNTDFSGKSVMQRIAKLRFKGGPKDLSANLDNYLYGLPKKR